MTFFKTITQRLFGWVAIDSLELNQGAWYIDDVAVTATASTLNATGSLPAQSVTAAMLGPDVAGTGLLGGNGAPIEVNPNMLQVKIAVGTGIGVNVPLTGIMPGDSISTISVFKPGATGYIQDRTSEYTAGTNVLVKAAGTDETGSSLFIVYRDLTV